MIISATDLKDTTLFITTLAFYEQEMLNRCTTVWISTCFATLPTAWGLTKFLSMGMSTQWKHLLSLFMISVVLRHRISLYLGGCKVPTAVVVKYCGNDAVKIGKYLPPFWKGLPPPPTGQSTESKPLWHDGKYVPIYMTSYPIRPDSSPHLFFFFFTEKHIPSYFPLPSSQAVNEIDRCMMKYKIQ